jgi:D-alanine-D-alanine ligase
MLAQARSRLQRLTPPQAQDALAAGALLVDIRPDWQRAAEGEVPGALLVERNHLEWRFDPACDARLPQATGYDVQVIVLCSEGYTSSLAADSLRALGLHRATDVIGGFHAWSAEGIPVQPAPGVGSGAGTAGSPRVGSAAMTDRRLRVAVVFGGRSSEHAISCVSAGSVLAHLDRARFDVIPVGISADGAWVQGTDEPAELMIRNRKLPAVDGAAAALALPGDPTRRELVRIEGDRAGEVLSGIDVVFPVLHGAFGEDGTIQGLLELADLPYVGSGVLASAAGMDKEFARKLLGTEGLPVTDAVVLRADTATLTADQRERLGLPVFVKPARAGSSMGITKVVDWSELPSAIATARAVDPKVLIEAAVIGREIECGVLEFPDGRVEASLPAEIRLVAEDSAGWYDFDAKYLDNACEFDIPAKLDDDVAAGLRAMAVSAFRSLDCQGLARVDFFVGPDGALTVNEINTMPGFTPISMYPRMWAVTGVDYPTLLSTLIDTAVARGTGLR